MANTTVQSRVQPELKQQADMLFASMGMTTSDAVRLFLQQSVNIGGLPFQPMAKLPNAITRQAMQEMENGQVHKATNLEDFYHDLGI